MSDFENERLKICQECEIFQYPHTLRYNHDGESFVQEGCCRPCEYNPETGKISDKAEEGFIHVCNCGSNGKRAWKKGECPIGKWGSVED